MAVTSTVVSANLRLVDEEGSTINGFRRINPNAHPEQFARFNSGISLIRGEPPAATFLTVTSALERAD